VDISVKRVYVVPVKKRALTDYLFYIVLAIGAGAVMLILLKTFAYFRTGICDFRPKIEGF
jgi:hypothetical protein